MFTIFSTPLELSGLPNLLVNNAEFCYEHDKHVVDIGDETDTYKYLNSRAVRNESRATKINELLANITILDPAVGSGAFPVGLLIELVKVRKLLSIYTKQNLSVYELKLHAITNSIYGVDIDAGAIDIARLRLWLSLIVDENDHDKINALPNLDYKIIYGNSLTA